MRRNPSTGSDILPCRSALAGEPKSIKRLRSGDLLIEVNRGSHSTNLLKATEIAGKLIKFTRHRTLNTSQGVTRSYELKHTTSEKIVAQLGGAAAIRPKARK